MAVCLGIASLELQAATNSPSSAVDPAAAPPAAPPKRSAAELEKLAMPIALHPDPLLSIILPASVYPVEIVQAARFVKDTNNIPKIDDQPWDENVRSVAKFPEMIAKMDADLGWTAELGQAFLEQPKELMDTIQSLRAKAQKAGTLQSNPQQVVTVTNVVIIETNFTQIVTVTNQIVQVQPANPQVVYVPTYPPTVYAPPPSYVYDPWAPLISFGVAVGITAIIANNCDWHGGCVWVGGGGAVWVGGGGHGDVNIDIDNDINIDRGDRPTPRSGDRASTTGAKPSQQKWQPNQSRLNTAGAPTASTREARGWGSGGTQASSRPASGAARPSQSPSVSSGAARPSVGGAARPTQPTYNWSQPPARPAGGSSTAGQRPSTPSTGTRPSASPSVNRPSPSPSTGARSTSSSGQSFNRSSGQSAFGGVNSGSSARSAGSRGAASRGSMGGRGGGRGR